MSVVAKFLCNSNDPTGSINLHTVYDPNPESENGKFFSATPSGHIQLGVVNPTAAQYFEPGFEYRVTFEKVEKENV